ncbi:transmembrane 9 superfamily member 1 [Olea europaea subsp. europaea]|uniref:Transmembrane 9 superfamily member n=1 Tax=Olea europaea subsp. europaea TaxID=158383 RepID=A0A8S0SUR0_OLEEU|nr:transmembrane 9 superfamily member 1 [Olea europaea subsp. europaea]
MMGGLLPFGCIFIEMYFVFSSFWNYKLMNDLNELFVREEKGNKRNGLAPVIYDLNGKPVEFILYLFVQILVSVASCWQVYYVYGFMLLVFLILIIVTSCVTVVATYFLLNAENYHWQWTSFLSTASTAVYVYLYSIYYYYSKTKMSGFFQTSFYFGYTLMFCLGLGILCGAVGYLGSNLFVRRIYRNIKCD